MAIPTVEEVLTGETDIFLATIDGDQPRVRPVTLVEFEGRFYVLTGSENNKVHQIKLNNKIEVVKLVHYENRIGYIRFNGQAKLIENQDERTRIAQTTSFFSEFWSSPQDPKYTLLHLIPKKIEYLKPGQMLPVPIDKLNFAK